MTAFKCVREKANYMKIFKEYFWRQNSWVNTSIKVVAKLNLFLLYVPYTYFSILCIINPEAVTKRFSLKQVFLNICVPKTKLKSLENTNEEFSLVARAGGRGMKERLSLSYIILSCDFCLL